MANVRDTFGTDNFESGIKKLDVRDFIFHLEPDEAPFVTLLSKIRKEKTDDMEFSWFQDKALGKWTQINNAGAAYAAGTTELVVDDADIFQIGDLVKAVATGEVMRVTGVDPTGGAAQHIDVTRGFGTTAAHADAVANNAYLFRLGQSMAEGYTAGDQLITTKTKVSNYVQLFSRTVQITENANAVSTYGGNRRNLERKNVGVALKRDMEAQFLFGEPYLDATGPKYQTGGIKYFMGSTSSALNCAGALHKDDFDGWLRDAFAYGSSEKFLFASGLAISYITGWTDAYVRTDPGSIKTWGIKFSSYTSPFGTVNIIHNKNLAGPYAGECLLIDMKELVYRFQPGLDIALKTDIQAKNVHSFQDEYSGTIGLEFHNAEKHARIYGIS